MSNRVTIFSSQNPIYFDLPIEPILDLAKISLNPTRLDPSDLMRYLSYLARSRWIWLDLHRLLHNTTIILQFSPTDYIHTSNPMIRTRPTHGPIWKLDLWTPLQLFKTSFLKIKIKNPTETTNK